MATKTHAKTVHPPARTQCWIHKVMAKLTSIGGAMNKSIHGDSIAPRMRKMMKLIDRTTAMVTKSPDILDGNVAGRILYYLYGWI